MNYPKEGYIKISRKLFDHRFWLETREFSRLEAWIDLIQLARYEPTTLLLNGKEIALERGELIASRRFLEQRWGWGNSRVDSFIRTLEKNEMITRRSAHQNTILTLSKYQYYNDTYTLPHPTDAPPTRRPHADHTPNIKKEKKEKTVKEEKTERDAPCAPPPPITQSEFFDSLAPFVGQYGRSTVRAFFDYWSETDPSGKRMRWQMQKTWETPKRLAAWKRRENQPHTHTYENDRNRAITTLKQHVISGFTTHPDTDHPDRFDDIPL